MWFENFQDDHQGAHPGYRNRLLLAILNLYVPSIMFLSSVDLRFGRRIFFQEFQDGHHGGHLGYRNEFSNKQVAPMPPAKF